METTVCECGVELTAADLDALAGVTKDHFDIVHPEYAVTLLNVTDYLDAERRLSTDTDRLPVIGDVEVHLATPERLDDLRQFFDHDAFAGNPAWAACYCMFHHVGGGSSEEWPHRSFQQNRDDMSDRIRTGATTGLLAYVDGRVAGWCNASPRSSMPEHAGSDGPPDEAVGSIVCFLVAPPYRNHGVAAKLLEGALGLLKELGFQYAEGYPREDPPSAASAYRGTPELFARAGFSAVGDGSVVRKSLT